MIYFARHGESQANLDKISAGRTYPAPLTEKGRLQAKIGGEKIRNKHLKIDRIIASPLERAGDTARIIATAINFDSRKIQYDDRLTEYDMGTFAGQPENTLQPEYYAGSDQTENPDKFQERVISCIQEMKSLPGNTLIVSHDYVGRIIEATRQGMKPEDFYKIEKYPNAEIIPLP